MKLRKEDILTPANAVSIIGLALTIGGALNINSVGGVMAMAMGRALDIADGFIARRTHASIFGAAVDATFDKLGVAAMVIQSARHGVAPLWIVLTIAIFNSINVITTLYAHKKEIRTETSKHGKHAMFGQNTVIAGYALAHALNGNQIIEGLSILLFFASLPSAVLASYGYSKRAFHARS